MELVNALILVGSGLLVVSIFTSLVSFRIGAPLLLVFLGVGMFAGEDGVVGIPFSDVPMAFFIGSIALAVILFDSGFRTPMASYRVAALPAIALATLGVLLTTAILGVVAHLLFGLAWSRAFLLAAIVSSTDAAAVFFLLRVGGITIRERVRSTLEIESGSNDPVAILLVIALTEWILAGGIADPIDLLAFVALQFGGGIAFGLAGGFAIVWVVNRVRFDPGLYPIAVLALAVFVFAVTNALGGSGFLAAYLAGLVAGNRPLQGGLSLRRFQDALTWFAQIVMFVTLGLLATPSRLPVLLPAALVMAAALMFLARPLAVWLCLMPFRFGRRETAFAAWVGLRGAVSLLLALVPALGGVEGGNFYFDMALLLVLFSLLVQGWTIRPVARWLGLIMAPKQGPVERIELELPGLPNHEMVTYTVHQDSPVAHDQRLPRWARPVLIRRDGTTFNVHSSGPLRAGDHLYLLVPPSQIPLLDKLFAGPLGVADDDRDFFGDFALAPEVKMGTLAELYGLPLAVENGELALGELLRRELGAGIEVGDRLAIGAVELIVRETDGARVTAVGMSLEPGSAAPPHIPFFQRPHEIAAAIGRLIRRLRRRWRERNRHRA